MTDNTHTLGSCPSGSRGHGPCRRVLLLAALSASGWGCGGMVSLVLKPPLSDACSSTGLKGCPELTDGIILYVEGKEKKAQRKLIKAAGKNSPAELQAFLELLKGLGDLPGLGEHMKPILEVVAILEGSADLPGTDDTPDAPADPQRRRAATATTTKPAASAAPPTLNLPDRLTVVTAAEDPSRIRTRTYVPATRSTDDCGETVPFEGDTAKCFRARRGPFVITDIRGGRRCKIFLASGGLDEKPKWVVRSPFQLQGARLLIPEGKRLIIGTYKLNDGCAVTVSGFKPYNPPKPKKATRQEERLPPPP